MEKYKYKATWSANNSTYGSISFNNLKQGRKDVREIVKGNTFIGSSCSYVIWECDKNNPIRQIEKRRLVGRRWYSPE